MRIVLVLSLALNLLIVGVVAGAVLGNRKGGGPVLRDMGLGPFVQAMPREDRRAMAAALVREAGPFRENRRALGREIAAMLAVLRSDPLDEAALRSAIDRQRGRISERLALGSDIFVAQIATMSAAERLSYADALEKALRAPRRRDGASTD